MPDVKIESLVMKFGDMDPRLARQLAEQVAAGLERAPIASDLPQRGELVRLQVQRSPGASTAQLTQQILAELMRELRRS
jgi:hypothetical protein